MTEHEVAQAELQRGAEAICPGARASLGLDLVMKTTTPRHLARWQARIVTQHHYVFAEGDWDTVRADALSQLRRLTASR